MKLLLMNYRSNKPRQMLVLCLGTNGTKLICIESDRIDNASKKAIKDNSRMLNNLSLDRKILWMRQNCTIAMANCKTLMIDRCEILKQFDM